MVLLCFSLIMNVAYAKQGNIQCKIPKCVDAEILNYPDPFMLRFKQSTTG